MEVISSYETTVHICQSTKCYSPEDFKLLVFAIKLKDRENISEEAILLFNTFTAIVDLSRSNFSIARTPLFQLKSAM